MAGIGRHLFESPLYVYILLAVAETVVAAAWYARRSRQWALALLPAPVLVVAVALADHFVQTDHEKIVGSLKAIAAAAERRDLAAAAEYLDPSCRAPRPGGTFIDRDGLIARARRALEGYGVRIVAVGSVHTDIAGANATTLLRTRIGLGGGLLSGRSVTVSWRLQWARRPSGWRIVRVEVTDPPNLRGMGI